MDGRTIYKDPLILNFTHFPLLYFSQVSVDGGCRITNDIFLQAALPGSRHIIFPGLKASTLPT